MFPNPWLSLSFLGSLLGLGVVKERSGRKCHVNSGLRAKATDSSPLAILPMHPALLGLLRDFAAVQSGDLGKRSFQRSSSKLRLGEDIIDQGGGSGGGGGSMQAHHKGGRERMTSRQRN